MNGLDSCLVCEDLVLAKKNIPEHWHGALYSMGHTFTLTDTNLKCLSVSILVYVHFFISECLISLHITFWGEIDVSAGGSAIEVMIACHCQCCLPETVREISHRIQAVPALEIVLPLRLWCNRFEKRSKKV